jgi:hypothetical protein
VSWSRRFEEPIELPDGRTIHAVLDGAFGRYLDIAVEPPDQQFPDLARAPVRLLGLEPDNQALDLLRKLLA